MATRVTLLLAASIMSAATLTIVSRAHAATNYPWCVEYGGGRNGIDATGCGFVSRDQCMQTASGMNATCVENPAYIAPTRQLRQARHRKQQ